MKKIKKVPSLFLGSMLLFLGACQQAPKKENPQEKPQEKIEPPKQIISLEESKSLFDNYSRNRVDLIQKYEMERNSEEEFHPARFVSWDYDTLKQYMAFIEQEAKAAEVDISELRFYFANYPNKKDFPDKKRIVHARQNSIFILPAMEVDGKNYGFYIGEDGKAKLVKNAVGEKSIGNVLNDREKSYAGFVPSLSAPPTYTTQSLTLNRGNSAPPPPHDY
ncbi:MAG: hypothetical protein ABJN84_15805 [Flavobacteriaceae bacterium]